MRRSLLVVFDWMQLSGMLSNGEKCRNGQMEGGLSLWKSSRTAWQEVPLESLSSSRSHFVLVDHHAFIDGSRRYHRAPTSSKTVNLTLINYCAQHRVPHLASPTEVLFIGQPNRINISAQNAFWEKIPHFYFTSREQPVQMEVSCSIPPSTYKSHNPSSSILLPNICSKAFLCWTVQRMKVCQYVRRNGFISTGLPLLHSLSPHQCNRKWSSLLNRVS